ncbi:MAG TPA: TetR/AcrR family transcriptional regulator [Armatimonadetes bacterium]|jgi:AcrR family transcriptional regulator|nr:TetR/AcrR family transcriptional regulator [Armatimonadota bacterium]
MAEKRKRLTAEERRERILEAALELFAEQGYAASTTRELARRAGITEPVIYLHFESKEAVLREVFQRHSFLPHLRQFAALEGQAPLRDQLLKLGTRWRHFIRERHHLVTLVFREIHRVPEMDRVFRETLRAGLPLAAEAIRTHSDMTGYRSERLEAAIRLFLSSLLQLFLLEGPALFEEDSRIDALMEESVDLLVDGLRIPPGDTPAPAIEARQ